MDENLRTAFQLTVTDSEFNNKILVDNTENIIKFTQTQQMNDELLSNLQEITSTITKYKLNQNLFAMAMREVKMTTSALKLAYNYSIQLRDFWDGYNRRDLTSKLENFVNEYSLNILITFMNRIPFEIDGELLNQQFDCFGAIMQLLNQIQLKVDTQTRIIHTIFDNLRQEQYYQSAIHCLNVVCECEANAVYVLTFRDKHPDYDFQTVTFVHFLSGLIVQQPFDEGLYRVIYQFCTTIKERKDKCQLIDPLLSFQIIRQYSEEMEGPNINIVLELFEVLSLFHPLIFYDKLIANILKLLKSAKPAITDRVSFILCHISLQDNEALIHAMQEEDLKQIIKTLYHTRSPNTVECLLAFIQYTYWWTEEQEYFLESQEFMDVITELQESPNEQIQSSIAVFRQNFYQ